MTMANRLTLKLVTRLQQFLSYVVEEALAGRDNAIRAKAIAEAALSLVNGDQ